MSIKYISTRGAAPALSFADTVLAGLASDGGLYVPETIPVFSKAELEKLRGLSYVDLAYAIISRFVGEDIAPEALRRIINESYKEFRDPAITPLKKLDDNLFVLELFHGPTLAFKDFALQFLGRLLEHILETRKEKLVIIGATSGDTGSAAIAGCRERKNMELFILHPYGRVSEVQRRQMTTVLDKNIHNIAIKGTFDDCQNIVKTLFGDAGLRAKYALTAVNSINWARIVAQIPYYFYAALKFDRPVSFSVPTGNFGDIYAGYIAKCMGLKVRKLIIATNRNDILTRCLKTGVYSMGEVVETLSPSMDIQVSSNFERLLFDLYERDGKAVATLMNDLKQKKSFSLSPEAHTKLKAEFDSASANHDETLRTISDIHKTANYLVDPHTAVGLAAGMKCHQDSSPLVCLATAHPAKFPDAVKEASGIHPDLPEHLKDLLKREEKFEPLKNDVAAIKSYIEKCARNAPDSATRAG